MNTQPTIATPTATVAPALTVKNYKSCRGMEFDAFSATLYVDGKRSALLTDSGRGGEIMIDWSPSGGWSGATAKRVDAWVKSLPRETCTFSDPETGKPATIAQSMDYVIGMVVEQHTVVKQLKRMCKKHVVVEVLKDGEVLHYQWKYKDTPALRAHFAKTYERTGQTWSVVNDRF